MASIQLLTILVSCVSLLVADEDRKPNVMISIRTRRQNDYTDKPPITKLGGGFGGGFGGGSGGAQQVDIMGYDYPVPSNRLSYPGNDLDFSHKQYERSQGFNSNYNQNIAQQMHNFGDNRNHYQSNAMPGNNNYQEPARQINVHHNNQDQKYLSQQQYSEDEGYRYEQPSQMYYQDQSSGFNTNKQRNNLVSERVYDFVRQGSQRDSSIGYGQLNLFGSHIQPLLKQYF